MKRAKIARALRQTVPHKQTNFDRIAASPEALVDNVGCRCCVHAEHELAVCKTDKRTCAECRLAWLKEEAK